MKKKITSQGTERKVKELREMFPEQWREKVRQSLDEMKDGDGLNKSMGSMFELVLHYKCIGDIALEYAPKDLFGRIVVDAEKVCNDLGTSLIRDGDEVSTCMTKRHSDCTGSYVNTHPNVRRTLICKCECHQKS